jgi:hypothetical protein
LAGFDDVVSAIAGAREVALSAFVLGRGRLTHALEAAADRGAHVVVELEGAPYAPSVKAADGMRTCNAATAAELRAHGVRAHLRADDEAPLHLKGAVIDGVAFLDDRNWAGDGRETILRSERLGDAALVAAGIAGCAGRNAGLVTQKNAALALEAETIAQAARGAQVLCESESFGPSVVARALAARSAAGERVRLLVDARALGAVAFESLDRLEKAGVEIRLGAAAEKLCIAGDAGWLGSANATVGRPETLDWGFRTSAPAIVADLAQRFEQRWEAGKAFAHRPA